MSVSKNPQTYNGRNVVGHSSAFIFDWIFFILSAIKDMHKCLNEFDFGQNPPLTTE